MVPDPPLRRAAWPALLLTFALAACQQPRPDPSSGIELPERLRAATAEPANWPAPEWWRGFASPELDALMARAVAENYDIRVAMARVRQADAQVRVTGQSLLPSGNLTGNVTRSQSPTTTASGANIAGRSRFVERTLYQTQLQASYEVDFWGKNRAAVEAAQQTLAANRFDVGAVTLTTEASVANTYFAVLAAQEQFAIQQGNLATAERILGLIRQRQEVGTASGLDVAQQQTIADQQRAQLPPLRQAVEQNTNSLGTLTAQVPEAVPVPRVRLAAIRVPPVQPGLPAEMLVRRPDVWEAEARLAAAQANIANARAALFPSLQLTTTGGFQNLLLENLLRPGSTLFSLAAGLTQPVFQYGQLRAQLALQRGIGDELLESYRKSIIAALVDVENALVALRDTTEQESLQSAATASAQNAYNIAEAQLRAGTIDVITLLNTQITLFNARNTLTQVRLARLQAAVGLFRALGGGWS